MKAGVKPFRIALVTVLIILAVFVSALFVRASETDKADASVSSATLTSDETEYVTIVKDGETAFGVLYSVTDGSSINSTVASSIAYHMSSMGASVSARPATVPGSNAHFILIGVSPNHPATAELMSEVEAAYEDGALVWAIAERDGNIIIVANNSDGYLRAKDEFLSLSGEDEFTVQKGYKKLTVFTKADQDAEYAANKQLRIDELKKKIAGFDDSVFGEREPMDPDYYAAPLTYPTVGQHPRLGLTADMLPKIREILENPEYKALADEFWAQANTDFDGVLPDVSTLKKTYNWDGKSAAIIQAKALAYLLTGDEEYGYQAIYAAKNQLLTFYITHDIATDIFRIYGWVMYTTGVVYDWCYDLMTETDKSQFVRGVQKFCCEDCVCGSGDKMTIGFPPTGQNALAGHGTNVALQRDYIAFSIAIFDEYPDWWELVGGRFYAEFVPANNVFYAAGMYTQGTNTYVWGKFYAQLCSAWLVKTMSGEMPYDSGIEDVVYGLMGLRLPNGNVFQSGDGKSNNTGHSDAIYAIAQLGAALFPSEILQRNARIMSNNYTKFQYFNGDFMIPTLYLTLRARGLDTEAEGEDKNEGLPLVFYYGSPMGQMTVRDEWTADAAVTFMRISEVSGTNHDHQDAGTFQIYYKGCFSSESSAYGTGAGYGTSVHDMWSQSTISHNGILVYNPALTDTEIVWGEKGGFPCVSNKSRYYYSGGQRIPQNIGSAETWTMGDCRTATVTGYDYYLDVNGEVKHAYLAGNLADAYPSATVEDMERRMLTVYTDDEEFPMFFVVYDYVKSVEEHYRKSFLLHITNEPVISGNTAYFEQEGGRIVLTTLTDGGKFNAFGGAGKTYWINGYVNEELGYNIPDKNCNIAEQAGGTGADKGDSDYVADSDLWGRIQVDNIGNLEDHLLNVIYVTDAGNERFISPTKFETEKVIGMQMENIVSAFCKGTRKCSSTIEFTAEGSGLYRYFVSGLSEGSWTVRVDGVAVAHAHTTAESGLIDFTAPSGTVTVEPGRDVRPDNTDDIKYYTDGGILPDSALYFYTHDVEYVLPVIEDTPEAKFMGWYVSETSTERIYSIEEGTRGTVKLYARYLRKYLEDYEATKLSIGGLTNSKNSLTYGANAKTGASFATKTEGTNTYLLWKAGEKDPELSMSKNLPVFLTGSTTVTFRVDLALDGDNPAIASSFRLRALTPEAEIANATGSHCASVFSTTADGRVLLVGNEKLPVGKLTDKLQTFIFSVDFTDGTVYAFNGDGMLLETTTLTLASPDQKYTFLEYMSYCTTYIFNWRAPTQIADNHALKIDNIGVSAGMPENALFPDEDAPNAIVYHYPKDLVSIEGSFKYFRDEENPTVLPAISTPPEFYTFEGWYSDPEHQNKLTEIPAGGNEPFHVYAWIKHYSENPYTVVYNYLNGAVLPDDCVYYRTPGVAASLPEITSPAGYEFLGWFTDSNFTQQIFEIPGDAGPESIFLYARWRMEWSEDYENSNVNSYYENEGEGTKINAAGGITYTGNGYVGASYKTVEDENGNRYILWRQGKTNSQMYTKPASGGINSYIGDDKAVTYRVKIALEPGATPTPSRFRIQQTGAQSITVFQVSKNGDVYLNANSSLKIATLTEEFTEIIVTVDFAKATITAYNEDGSIKTTENGAPLIVENLKKPSSSDALDLLDFINKTNYGWVWQAEANTDGTYALRIDDIHMNSGVYNMKKLTADSTEIFYEGLNGGKIEGDYPENYDREGVTKLPTNVSSSSLLYTFDGWYADKELTVPVTEISAGTKGPFTVYAKWLPYTESKNAIIYNELRDAVLPDGTIYFHSANKTTALPDTLSASGGYVFVGWYSDAAYTSQIFEVPAGLTEQFNVYARWRKTTEENFDDEDDTVNVSCPDADTAGLNKTLNSGLSLELNKKTGAAFETVKDEGGNTYLKWTSGAVDPLIRIHGSLPNWIGNETSVTFSIKLAREKDSLPIASSFRIQQTSAQSIPVFTTTADGTILLNGNKNLVVGTLTETLTQYVFTVDFAAATITAYNEDGTVAKTSDGTPLVVTGLKVPEKDGATDNASDLIEYIGKTNYAFSWQDTTASDKCGVILIDDIKVISGPYILKTYTKDSADILYEGLNDITLPEDAPLLYDRENGTDLPESVPTDSELITFDGWYSDPELTKPIERIPAGAIGPVSVYAKWVYYTERNDAIIYNGIELGDLPAGSAYYSAKDEATPLPKVGFIVGDKALEGWYSDEALTKRITEVPAGVDSQYTVYAGWVPVLRVDFDDCTLNSYNKTGSAVNNGAYKNLSFNLSNKVGAGYIATEDANGGKYLVWVKGNSDDYNALTDEEKATTWVDSKGVPAYDPQWQKNGKLHEFLGESTSFTFSVDLAKNAVSTHGEEVTYDSLYNSVVLMRVSGTDSFSLFATDADGNVYLGSYSGGIKIGELGGEFTRFTVSFDFATGMLRAHNADGSVMTDAEGNAIEKLISVPQKALEDWSEDREMTMLDWLYTLNTYYFVWRSEGSARGSMRIDNFDMRAGIPVTESTEI